MPRLTIDYDSDSAFERDHLELATHAQIFAYYQKAKNDKTLSNKEREQRLEHATEKAFLALKRAETKLEKADEKIAELSKKVELEDMDAKLRLQLEYEREKNANSELKRELLVYEGVLPPYLDIQPKKWIMDRRVTWERENKAMRDAKEEEEKRAGKVQEQISPAEKTQLELGAIKVENAKMRVQLETNVAVHTMNNAMGPGYLVRLAEENMVLKRKWEKSWEVTKEKRAREEKEGERREEERLEREREEDGEAFEEWKVRQARERRREERAQMTWRERHKDNAEANAEAERLIAEARR